MAYLRASDTTGFGAGARGALRVELRVFLGGMACVADGPNMSIQNKEGLNNAMHECKKWCIEESRDEGRDDVNILFVLGPLLSRYQLMMLRCDIT